MKLKSIIRIYFISSGIFLNLIFISMIFYGFYKINQLGVSFEDIVNKSADKIYPKSPKIAALIQKITEKTDDEWMFEDIDTQNWKGKGAYFLAKSPLNKVEETPNNKIINVSNTKTFLNALKQAKSGQIIKLEAGVYKISKHSIYLKNSGSAMEPISVVAAQPGQVTIELDTQEGFFVDKPFWLFKDLIIKGVCKNDSRCEHAFHIVGNGNHVLIRNNIISDFNSAIKVNGIKSNNEFYYPDDGRIEQNSFFNHDIRHTGNSVTVLDIVAVNDWVVSDNFIADFIKEKSNRVSYAAFFKGNGSRNIFERNLVICRLNLKPVGGTQLGVSFGGGGTGKSYCRDQQCDVEHDFGMVRHNIIMNCNDVGIYLNKSQNSEVYNNMLINTLGIDVRFAQSSAVIANNFLTGRIKNRNGGTSELMNNIVSDLSDIKDFFEDPMSGVFTLKSREDIIDKGINLQSDELDFCRKTMGPDKVDIGAFEFASNGNTCNPLNMEGY